jgi:hypothetical protein
MSLAGFFINCKLSNRNSNSYRSKERVQRNKWSSAGLNSSTIAENYMKGFL